MVPCKVSSNHRCIILLFLKVSRLTGDPFLKNESESFIVFTLWQINFLTFRESENFLLERFWSRGYKKNVRNGKASKEALNNDIYFIIFFTFLFWKSAAPGKKYVRNMCQCQKHNYSVARLTCYWSALGTFIKRCTLPNIIRAETLYKRSILQNVSITSNSLTK